MKSSLSTIFERISVRSYAADPVDPALLRQLIDHAENLGPGPFGNRVRFGLIDASSYDSKQLRTLGTYGLISGARHYLTGAVKPAAGASEDFGWLMEDIILKATELGLGTCWLGGTLDRKVFGHHIQLQPDEVLAAATPIGFPVARMPAKQKLIRTLIKADKRRPFGQLFFDGSPSVPLAEDAAGPWLDCLLAFRQAPSASNKQPWRVVRQLVDGKSVWHFFLDEDPPYNRHFDPIFLQNMDLGIAMRHFAAVAREQGMAGSFSVPNPAPSAGKWIHIASWV